MLPLLAPHPPPTQSTRKVKYSPPLTPPTPKPLNYCPSRLCVNVCVRVCVCPRACVSACMYVWLGDRQEKEQGHVPGAKREQRIASFNQIVLLIGDTGDRQRRAVTDSRHSPFPVTCLIWEKAENLLCCSFILSTSAAISPPAHPSYYNALYISPTNASHI